MKRYFVISLLGEKHKGIYHDSYVVSKNKKQGQPMLFLCDRHFDTGDTVYWVGEDNPKNSGKIVGKTMTDGFNFADEDATGRPIPFHGFGNWGRVVAVISPEVTWLKPGDELDENEIQIHHRVAFDKTKCPSDTTVIWRDPINSSLYWKYNEVMEFFPEKCTPTTIVGHQNEAECAVPRDICIDVSIAKILNPSCKHFH